MKRLSPNEQAKLVLLLAIIFGAWFRIMPAWLAGFPVNDGGMFYTMILDLQANHYVPPLFTSYNHLAIPFAYPPLGFYVGALLGDILNTSPINILRWLPGIINAFTLPAFYFFAKEVLKDKLQTAVAVLVFAFIPHLTSWESMGGGLTRSLGLLFMLLTLGFVQRAFEQNAARDWRNLLGAVVFGGLTTLSHTEAPIYTIAIVLLIWLAKSRSLKGLFNGVIIALGVLFIGGGWYGLVIYNHGFAPFQSISQTGAHAFSAPLMLLNAGAITEEPYLGLLAVMGMLGFAALISRNAYFIPLMLVVVFVAQPRSAQIMGNIPLALAAGFFAAEILFPALKNAGVRQTAVFVVSGVYVFVNSMSYAYDLSQKILAEDERTAMQWVKEHTPQDSAFVVVSGDLNAFCDPVTEWFPALSERQNLTTIQGTEWILRDKFGENMAQAHRAQSCIDEGLECFRRETQKLGKPFDYVYVSISPATASCGLSPNARLVTRGLILALQDSEEYAEAYRSAEVVVFKKK